jgi:hypothetical protein
VADKYLYDGATYNGDGLSSAVASGSTVTFTIASPGKVNWTEHGLAANALVYFGVTTAGVLPTGITAGTTYYVRNPGTNDFEVSATSGGASINFSGTPSGTANCTTTGAWNHIDMFTAGANPNAISGGTQGGGAVAAGDIIYIRSKNASNLDMTASINSASLTIGSANATNTAPVSWVLDGGTKWSGVNGTFTFSQTAAGNYGVTIRANNWVKAENQDKLVFSQSNSVEGIGTLAELYNGCILENALIDTSNNLSGSSYGAIPTRSNGTAGGLTKWRNCNFKLGAFYGRIHEAAAGYGTAQFINCNIELTRTKTAEADPLFKVNAANLAKWQFIGGRIFGVGAASAHVIVNTYCAVVEFIGTQLPSFESVELFSSGNGSWVNDSVRSFGADGKMGSEMWGTWGVISSRADNSPPTLNAVLPDSASTPWSYLIYPKGITSQYSQSSASLPALPISKLYTSAAAQKKITLEFLLSTTVANANKKTIWMDVVYIDNSDGLPRCLTTQAFTGTDALDTSTASWTPSGTNPTWGTKTFGKKKLEVTTPGSIKQDTAVHVLFHYGCAAPNTSDIAFVCPDIQLSTP